MDRIVLPIIIEDILEITEILTKKNIYFKKLNWSIKYNEFDEVENIQIIENPMIFKLFLINNPNLNEEILNDIFEYINSKTKKFKIIYFTKLEEYPNLNIDYFIREDSGNLLNVLDKFLNYTYSKKKIKNILSGFSKYKQINCAVIITGKFYEKYNENIKKIFEIIVDNYEGAIIDEKIIGGIDLFASGKNFNNCKYKYFFNKITDIDNYIDENNIKIKNDKFNRIKINNKIRYDLYPLYVFFQESKNIKYDIIIRVNAAFKICSEIDKSIFNNILLNSVNGNNTIYYQDDIFTVSDQLAFNFYSLLYKYYGDHGDRINSPHINYSNYSNDQVEKHLQMHSNNTVTFISKINIGNIVKKKILFITYYGLSDQLKDVADSLINHNYEVINFSYYEYKNQYDDKYISEKMIDIIKNTEINYVLWWILNINTEYLKEIYEMTQIYKVKHLFFNWDEPFNWDHLNISEKAKYIDYAFITCEETIAKYIESGAKNAYCLYPGHAQYIQREINNSEYTSDISIVCTNLYEDIDTYKYQIVNRKKLIDDIYKNQNLYGYKFNIYGPQKLKEIYPLSYSGELKYNETFDIFSKSRINLCTHVIGNKKGYLNERVFTIMASGGLLYVDPIESNILKNNYNCININISDPISQIVSILKEYNSYKITVIKNNGFITSKNYTWDKWGEFIKLKIT